MVTLRYPILSFQGFVSICEFLLFLHNTNIFVKFIVYFTMVKYLVFLYVSLYILLYSLKALVKIVPFFTTFQKFRNKSRKNTILKKFKNLFFSFFSVFMLKFLFRNIFNLFRKEIKVLTPFGGGCIVSVSKDKGVKAHPPIGGLYHYIKSM